VHHCRFQPASTLTTPASTVPGKDGQAADWKVSMSLVMFDHQLIPASRSPPLYTSNELTNVCLQTRHLRTLPCSLTPPFYSRTFQYLREFTCFLWFHGVLTYSLQPTRKRPNTASLADAGRVTYSRHSDLHRCRIRSVTDGRIGDPLGRYKASAATFKDVVGASFGAARARSIGGRTVYRRLYTY
jgi:hypothetical protein